jgi:hypothetical protein
MWWEKGTHFKDRIIHRGAATHTNTSSLSPLHKTLLQMCIHYLLIWHQTEKKKLCICKAILNVVRKADCITHTSSGTLSLEVSHNLLLAITNICTVYLKKQNTKYHYDDDVIHLLLLQSDKFSISAEYLSDEWISSRTIFLFKINL